MSHNCKSVKRGVGVTELIRDTDAKEIKEEKEGKSRERRGLMVGTRHVTEMANKIDYRSGKKAGGQNKSSTDRMC